MKCKKCSNDISKRVELFQGGLCDECLNDDRDLDQMLEACKSLMQAMEQFYNDGEYGLMDIARRELELELECVGSAIECAS